MVGRESQPWRLLDCYELEIGLFQLFSARYLAAIESRQQVL